MADLPDQPLPRPSYYVNNPWRTRATGCFAGASMMLTITAIFYALGRLPLPLVGISVLLAMGAFGFGLYARRRAARFDADLGNGPGH
ncbi:hypothetical protein MNQ95_10880 [Pseudoxanthomonas daejeonensis]|uniref:Transmembrane protein n=1 Tax=Pseudoxanthomonas daejeonensis TaxID=266062 RepID=A0ABQ6Z7B3_9GAMM|nr:hypothetical protein [Pseudoxanthomonas daejeonensis]KAF1694777.1 hypothetical protein CSC65_08790 [Pseudoxanthomonas daejeonensis]UNK56657.1 hypothetical protein MNQ95_10880 [Pseudoxanthomonas daejeonensis]